MLSKEVFKSHVIRLQNKYGEVNFFPEVFNEIWLFTKEFADKEFTRYIDSAVKKSEPPTIE